MWPTNCSGACGAKTNSPALDHFSKHRKLIHHHASWSAHYWATAINDRSHHMLNPGSLLSTWITTCKPHKSVLDGLHTLAAWPNFKLLPIFCLVAQVQNPTYLSTIPSTPSLKFRHLDGGSSSDLTAQGLETRFDKMLDGCIGMELKPVGSAKVHPGLVDQSLAHQGCEIAKEGQTSVSEGLHFLHGPAAAKENGQITKG